MRALAALALLFLGLACSAQESGRGIADFFPYGAYLSDTHPNPSDTATPPDQQVERAATDLEAHGFNCVWPNNLDFAAGLDLWLAAAGRHDLRVVAQGGGMPAYMLKWDDEALEDELKPFWYDLARKHRTTKPLLAYSLFEEPGPVREAMEAARTLKDLVAEVDPDHPVIVCYNDAETAEMGTRIIRPKVVGVDLYPFFGDPDSGPTTPAGWYSYYTAKIRRCYELARRYDASLWVVCQGMSSAFRTPREDGVTHIWIYPTPAMIRWQVWLALQNGAKGIFYFIYGSMESTNDVGTGLVTRDWQPTESYEAAAQVHRDLQPLIPLILRWEIAPETREVIYWVNNEWLRAETFVDRTDDTRYLMVVNTDLEKPHPVDIELGRYPGYMGTKDALIHLPSGKELTDRDLKAFELTPGNGAVFRVQRKLE